jgi:DNA-directed RNA polymerase subunit M/transcription elongation factor TFIIS
MRVYRLICPKCSSELLSAAGVPVGQKMTCARCGNAYEAALPPEEQIPVASEVPDRAKPKRKRKGDGAAGWAHTVLTRMVRGEADEPKDRYLYIRVAVLLGVAAVLGVLLYLKIHREQEESAEPGRTHAGERVAASPLIREGLNEEESKRDLAIAQRLLGRWRAEDAKAVPEGLALWYELLDTGHISLAPPRGKKNASPPFGTWHVALVSADANQIAIAMGNGQPTVLKFELPDDGGLVLYAPKSDASMKYRREER